MKTIKVTIIIRRILIAVLCAYAVAWTIASIAAWEFESIWIGDWDWTRGLFLIFLMGFIPLCLVYKNEKLKPKPRV